jgi:hypothetical protein
VAPKKGDEEREEKRDLIKKIEETLLSSVKSKINRMNMRTPLVLNDNVRLMSCF